MEDPVESPAAALRRLINGFEVSQALHVVATLGIADLLDEPRSAAELAASTETHPDSLYRLLRAVAAAGVLHEDAERRFSLTPIGERLRADAPDSLAGWAKLVGRPYFWSSWGNLLHSIRTGETAFEHIYGTDVWTWRRSQPEDGAIFDDAMQSVTRWANTALLEAFDFGRFRTVADVGGGNGTLLASILAAFPSVEGVLFDQPHVVSHAENVLAGAGVADRCRVVGGSFFEAVPDGCDAYVLKSVLHDWEDAEAAAILRVCRAAAGDASALLLVERIVPDPGEGIDTKFSDLNMLVLPGGRERTLDEWRSLLDGGGFRLVGETRTASPLSVLEAVPA